MAGRVETSVRVCESLEVRASLNSSGLATVQAAPESRSASIRRLGQSGGRAGAAMRGRRRGTALRSQRMKRQPEEGNGDATEVVWGMLGLYASQKPGMRMRFAAF